MQKKVRSKLFNTALSFANINRSDFAKQHNVNRSYVTNILSGNLSSVRFEKKIHSFIKEQFKLLKSDLNRTMKQIERLD